MSDDFTVGDLIRHLQVHPLETKLTFSGGLAFYRVKRWADDEVYIEFNEPLGDLSPRFKQRNPNVKAVFIDVSGAFDGTDGIVGNSIDVGVD